MSELLFAAVGYIVIMAIFGALLYLSEPKTETVNEPVYCGGIGKKKRDGGKR